MGAEQSLLGVSILLGAVTLGFLGLLLSSLQKNPAIIKARIFLHYDKIQRFFALMAILMAVVIVVQMYIWVALTPLDWFRTDQVGNFVPYGVFSLLVYVAVIYFCTTIYRILRDKK